MKSTSSFLLSVLTLTGTKRPAHTQLLFHNRYPPTSRLAMSLKGRREGVGTFCCQNPPQKEDFTQGQRSTPNPASASEMLSNNINISMHSNTKRRGRHILLPKKPHKKPALLNRNTGRCSLKNLDRKKCLPPLLRCCGGWILKSILCRYGYVTMLDRAS